MTNSIPHTHSITRKQFLNKLLIVWAAILSLAPLYVFVRYLLPPRISERLLEMMNAGRAADLPMDSARLVKFNKTPVFLTKNQNGQVKALSGICTHLGCVVEFRQDDRRFHCNCHGSVFEIDGSNVAGPAPRPLQSLRVELKDDNIIVYRT
jgi:cytochrome b6-f complex iron-sulfur subunit